MNKHILLNSNQVWYVFVTILITAITFVAFEIIYNTFTTEINYYIP